MIICYYKPYLLIHEWTLKLVHLHYGKQKLNGMTALM